MNLPVVITPGENGYLVAEIPVLPGRKCWLTSRRPPSFAWKAWRKRAGLYPREYTLEQVEVSA